MSEESENIFDLAGKRQPIKKKIASSGPPAAQNEAEQQRTPTTASNKKLTKKQLAADAAQHRQNVAKIEEMRDGLDRQLDSIYSEAGLSQSSVEQLLDNPANYQGASWEQMQEQRKALRKQISEKATGKAESNTAEKENKGKKGAKGKTLGARKGWLFMR